MLIPLKTLQKRFKINPLGVLHIGANIGEEAQAYHDIGIKKVLWIEANPKLMETLTDNIRKFEGQHAFNFAAGDKDWEDVTLHISNNASQSSSILQLGTHKVAHPDVHYVEDVTVKMFTIKSFFGTRSADLGENGVDFLNIDIQGAELMALRGMGDLLKQFKWAYLEVNREHLYENCPLVEDIDLYMLSYGFRRVVTEWAGNTGWGDALYSR